MSTAQCKIAGAPISWGVREVPGWGYQLPADRVLNEMREIGLARQVQSGRRTYTEAVRDGMYRPFAAGMSMSLRSSGTCAGKATTAGPSSSRTPSSPRNPAARARWPTCTPAPSTCEA
jgi:hypothetical protein